jgi:hypothetical protein
MSAFKVIIAHFEIINNFLKNKYFLSPMIEYIIVPVVYWLEWILDTDQRPVFELNNFPFCFFLRSIYYSFLFIFK